MPRESNRTTVLALVALFVVFGVGIVVSARLLTGERVLPGGQRIAILPIRGAIYEEDVFLDRLDGFRRDGTIEAFIIEIESPGGTVGASQSIFEAIRELRDEDERPVVAWMGDVAASGGYYAAMGADSVFALPGTITGSIGVIMEFPNAEELYRKVGVGWEVVKSGEHKDMGNLSRALSPGDREILQGLVDDVYEQFVGAVASNRSLSLDEVRGLADGRIYSGRQADRLGLVDGLRTLDEVVEALAAQLGLGGNPRLVRPAEPTIGLWDLLTGLSRGEARGLLNTVVPMHSGAPRLLYEWR